MIVLNQTTLVILAGGAGSRMGTPKALLRIGDQPILSYLLDRFDWPGPTMLVTAPGREHPPGCERFTTEVIDPVNDQGPLRGLLTALQHATTPTIIAITVDMPGLRKENLAWLVDRLVDHNDRIGIMCSLEGQTQPFPCALRASARTIVENQLNLGQRAVQKLDATILPAPANWDWTNLNHPQDWQSFVSSQVKSHKE